MKKQHRQQDKSKATKSKNAKSTKIGKKVKPDNKIHRHPLFGDVPLLEKIYVAPNGQTYPYTVFDLDYKPKIPFGAIRGNVQAQIFSPFTMPIYFYVDETITCVQCRNEFIFWAREQQYWYEVLKFGLRARAIRCPTCRKKNRTENTFETQLTQLHQEHKQSPQDPDVMIAIAETICSYYEKFQKGKLSSAVIFARQALKTDPKYFEGLYWEAIAQHYLNKPEKANALLLKFLEKASGVPRCRKLVRKAKAIVNQ
jgi:hypothetical protein